MYHCHHLVQCVVYSTASCTPWKCQKTRCFFMFSGDTEFCRILESIDIKGSISISWVKLMFVTVENNAKIMSECLFKVYWSFYRCFQQVFTHWETFFRSAFWFWTVFICRETKESTGTNLFSLNKCQWGSRVLSEVSRAVII